MLTKEELQKKVEELVRKERALLDRVALAHRDLNSQELVELNELELDLRKSEAELRQAENDREDTVYLADFNARGGYREVDMFGMPKRWSEIFGRQPRPMARKANLAEMVNAVKANDLELLRSLETRTMLGSDGGVGGFPIPEVVWSGIYNSALEESVTLDLVTSFPMTTDKLIVPAWDSENHVNGPIGGVKGQWLAEAGTASKVTPAMRAISFEPTKLAMYVAVSSECMQDSVSLSRSLGIMMRNSLAWSIDDAILNGDSLGKPTGILKSPARINYARAVANQVALADLAGMYGRLLPSSVNRAVWLMNPGAFGYALTLVTAAGQLLLSGQPGAAAKIPYTLFGLPVRVTEKCAALGSEGDVVLCDLSYYGLAQRETGRFEMTTSASWSQDLVDVRLIHRLAGQGLVRTPLKPANGPTLSPFVVLK